MKKIVYNAYIKFDGDWEKIYQAISSKEKINLNYEVPKNVMTIIDEGYLDAFKKMYKPPLVLEFYGNKKLLEVDNIISFIFNQNNEYIYDVIKKVNIINSAYCIKNNSLDNKTLNQLVEKGFSFIIICDSKINPKEIINSINVLYISENLLKTRKQIFLNSFERLSYHLGNLIIANKNSENQLIISKFLSNDHREVIWTNEETKNNWNEVLIIKS